MPDKKQNAAEKAKPKQTAALQKLIRYGKKTIPAFLFALFLGIFSSLLSLIIPKAAAHITDMIASGLTGSIDMNAIVQSCMLLIGLYGAGWFLQYFQVYVMLKGVTLTITKSLRRDIMRKTNLLPLRFFETSSFGDILSRVTHDVNTITEATNRGIISFISSVTLFVGSLIMMFSSNVLLALTAVSSSILSFVLTISIMKKTQKHFVQQQKSLGDMNGHIEEIYAGHALVKAYGGESSAKSSFDSINNTLYKSAWKSQFLSGLMMPLMNFIGNFGYVAVCVVGAALAAKGRITFGVIVSFTIYVGLFSSPLTQIAQLFGSMQAALAASDRVFSFLEEEEQSEDLPAKAHIQSAKGKVAFDHVRFGYEKDKIIIHDFSALALPGQIVAIVGPTGAGKTTIVNLLMRFYELDGGEIRIDDLPIQNLSRKNLREQFCMVLQDSWIFEGTLRENLVYTKEDVSDETLDALCREIGLTHFVHALPKGYDSILSEQSTISEGQKQLITIARAMLQNAPILILDEATSSIDTKTEKYVQEAMQKLSRGRTSFIIAHRLSTIQNADLILVMKDGDIVESGTHRELLAKNGFYAELYNSQFEEEE